MKTYEIIFSPTGGTKKVADILSAALPQETCLVDLTDSKNNFSEIFLEKNDVAVIAVPSYGGRVPTPAAERISLIAGNSAKAVLVCVYGNRAYEDTLTELQDISEGAGFRNIAAVAAIAEHSIARRFASGRPDEHDMMQLNKFTEIIKAKLKEGSVAAPDIPGNRPYKKSSGVGIVPKPTKDCVKCGLCAKLCPVQAIDSKDPYNTDSKACISCMRCVSVCPNSARKVNSMMMVAVNTMLKKVCSERKECELFI